MIIDSETHSIQFKSFENDYKQKFAKVNWIGLSDPKFTHLYLVDNNKYLVVFYCNQEYNVYDMENHVWINRLGTVYLSANSTYYSRSVLINDEIIILSNLNHLYFYYIGNNCITYPQPIHQYTFKTQNVKHQRHGMCIIDFTRQESISSSNDHLYPCYNYKLKILLFGGK